MERALQILLQLRYQELLARRGPFPELRDVGFRSFSQNEEDGVLLYLFSLIGAPTRRSVEICAGDGIECNTANLLLRHGWTGLLVDGDEAKVTRGREFYRRAKETRLWRPTFVHAWITAENVDALLSQHGFSGDVDLLSIDVDGMDYWIWKAIRAATPRVVVIESQDVWGPDIAVTVPYDREFRSRVTMEGPEYGGASLAALVKLGREKGYRLVGCERYGFNAFFVRSGIGEDVLPEIEPSRCFEHPRTRRDLEARLARVRRQRWIEV
ncbi:MAG: hypothetical protein ACREQ9_17535 [Candidatus Binatia bacterium]